jgi:hypothetical protein
MGRELRIKCSGSFGRELIWAIESIVDFARDPRFLVFCHSGRFGIHLLCLLAGRD